MCLPEDREGSLCAVERFFIAPSLFSGQGSELQAEQLRFIYFFDPNSFIENMFISQKPDRVWNGQLIPKWLFGKILISFNGLISEQPRQTEDYLIKEIPPYPLLVDLYKEQNQNSDLACKNLDC